MTTIDVIVPGAVVVGCVLFILLVWWLRRERPPAWDIAPAGTNDAGLDPVDGQALAAWHVDHGPAVSRWIATHEQLLARLSDAGLAVDLTDESLTEQYEQVLPGLENAVASHPAPVMRAELSAMQVAAESTIHAVRRSDYTTAERHHVTYLDYRELWVGRLRQFSPNDASMRRLRTTPGQRFGRRGTAAENGPPRADTG